MGIVSWLGEDEKDLEIGEGGKYGGEGKRRGERLEKVEGSKKGSRCLERLQRRESTETQDTRLTCIDDQPDNPLDVGLFTVKPGKMEDVLVGDGRRGDRDDLNGGAQDDPLDLKKPYSVSSRQMEGEGMRVARGESAFLSKSEIMCANAKVWLAEHVLGYVTLSQQHISLKQKGNLIVVFLG